MNIMSHTAEELKDPTGILPGDRYEVLLTVEVPEDDELYSEQGLYIKAIFLRDENVNRIVQYQLVERGTEAHLDFALEEDEEALLLTYCQENIK
ncbi:DUF6509 family protein [Rossellomorea aquimaris]|uniref:DUF6509 family protein n=1 Tax=Rossellomorea aquimaris TaxID=189382 RepID=UPI0007D09CC7|nr:DUF6509 family protein [Rossellomorea aquimaris]